MCKRKDEKEKDVAKDYSYLIMDFFEVKYILTTNQSKQVSISLEYIYGLLEQVDLIDVVDDKLFENEILTPGKKYVTDKKQKKNEIKVSLNTYRLRLTTNQTSFGNDESTSY